VLAGQLSQDRAADVRTDVADLAVSRYDHVALAELLDVPLVPCDARLADAPGNRAVVELYVGADA
jgi:predicted nucleic acid-binding protein